MAAGNVIIEVPWIVLRLRFSQIFLAIVILGFSANGLYWIPFGAWGLALFMSVATFIIAIYNITTKMVRSWKGAYNYWAIIALDIFGVIFWLSAMGDLAATRGTFVIPTTINSCVHESGGGVCNKLRVRGLSSLHKRAYVATNAYLATMSATAGLAAIEMIFFAVTLTIFGIHLTRYRASRRTTSQSGYNLQGGDLGNAGGDGTSYVPLVQPQTQYVAPQKYEQYASQSQQQPQYSPPKNYEPYSSQPPLQDQHWGQQQAQYQQPIQQAQYQQPIQQPIHQQQSYY